MENICIHIANFLISSKEWNISIALHHFGNGK